MGKQLLIALEVIVFIVILDGISCYFGNICNLF